MSTLSQFVGGSPIKSIQRGTITFDNTNTSVSATISSVDTTKTFLSFLGFEAAGTSDIRYSACRLSLTNATTVTATKHLFNLTPTVSYEVIEYN